MTVISSPAVTSVNVIVEAINLIDQSANSTNMASSLSRNYHQGYQFHHQGYQSPSRVPIFKPSRVPFHHQGYQKDLIILKNLMILSQKNYKTYLSHPSATQKKVT